jgi:hypothetical protein
VADFGRLRRRDFHFLAAQLVVLTFRRCAELGYDRRRHPRECTPVAASVLSL